MTDLDHEPQQAPTRITTKPQRTLACASCQQRKVKCDRKFPCSTCIKSGGQCIPVAAPRQRRRRFPEAELLQRVRHLEGLLRQHNIDFEPLHSNVAEKGGTESIETNNGKEERRNSPDIKTETTFEAKNLWQAMKQQPPNSHDQDDEDDDESEDDTNDLRDVAGKTTWDQLYKNSTDFLLFGSLIADLDLAVLHPPDHVQILKLWQVYLENVDPLLRITHTPTLQVRLINATGNLGNVDSKLEALMFGVYCVAIMSLTDIECLDMFGSERDGLLQRYRFGCQQALLKCGFLQSDDRDCLTALFLYLVAVRPDTDPRSLSSLLGLTVRIAQRMGLDNESANAGCGPLEGEMRRRIWWALLLFDNRICEMGDYRAVTLTPSWNCKIPANLNDFDLQAGMKTLPPSHDRPTESTLAVLRYAVADLVRHSSFFLDFTNPSLKALAKPEDHGGNLATLQQRIENDYLRHLNPENPHQFLTLWLIRGHIARYQLFQHFAISPDKQTQQQRDASIAHALTMLDCHNKILHNPSTQRHTWFLYFHYPFPAYIHILQYLKREPLAEHAKMSWEIMSTSAKFRFAEREHTAIPFYKTPLFKVFTRIVVKAWEARVAALQKQGKPDEEVPYIVEEFKRRVQGSESSPSEDLSSNADTSSRSETDESMLPFPMMNFAGPFDQFGGQDAPDMENGIASDNLMDVDMGALDLTGINWPMLNNTGS
ncbi:hypothetical protein QM012_007799 [Aureobasidium pullulans]|uniref:Zn(2)-C6 fungal-type domain-containing protein n=1 Tax=Aureobasidium pullulans TaxID=5580 RepID=A0ABR0TM88_AURPU